MNQKVKVHDSPYWAGCDAIWASIGGADTFITYEEVSASTLVPSPREDGYETLLLADGREAVVQSIDLDYL